PGGLPRLLRQRHAEAVGDPAHRLGEGERLGLHYEGEHVAVLAAAEAVEEAALLAHGERGRLFGVERAEPDRAAAAAAERDHLGDHLAQAGALARRSAIRPRSAATTQVPTKTTAHPSGCAATGGARRSSSRTFAAAGPATPAASTPAIDPARPKASRQRPRE